MEARGARRERKGRRRSPWGACGARRSEAWGSRKEPEGTQPRSWTGPRGASPPRARSSPSPPTEASVAACGAPRGEPPARTASTSPSPTTHSSNPRRILPVRRRRRLSPGTPSSGRAHAASGSRSPPPPPAGPSRWWTSARWAHPAADRGRCPLCRRPPADSTNSSRAMPSRRCDPATTVTRSGR